MTTPTANPKAARWGVFFFRRNGYREKLVGVARSENRAWHIALDRMPDLDPFSVGDWVVRPLPPRADRTRLAA